MLLWCTFKKHNHHKEPIISVSLARRKSCSHRQITLAQMNAKHLYRADIHVACLRYSCYSRDSIKTLLYTQRHRKAAIVLGIALCMSRHEGASHQHCFNIITSKHLAINRAYRHHKPASHQHSLQTSQHSLQTSQHSLQTSQTS